MRTSPSNHRSTCEEAGVTCREDTGAGARVEGKVSVFTEEFWENGTF